MLSSFALAVAGVVATCGLAGAAVAARALTLPAGAVAAVFGSLIVVLVGFPFLALLILFVVASVLATRYQLGEKRRRSVQEGSAGERGVSNVVAHIVVPTALAVAAVGVSPHLEFGALAVLYTSALAFGASDTFASEFGVLAGRARSILTLRPVEPGTNGGVSAVGQAFAFAGAVTTALVAVGLFAAFAMPVVRPAEFVATAVVAGFAGCQVDSVLGETLENRGILTKGTTNLLGMISSVAIAIAIWVAVGGTI